MKELINIISSYPIGTKLIINNGKHEQHTVFWYEFTNTNSLITSEGNKISCERLKDDKFLIYKELPKKG